MAHPTLAVTVSGLWFCRDRTGREVEDWLRTYDRLAPNEPVIVVPRGAPLLDRRSAVSNMRVLLGLSGQACAESDAITALRTIEIPDRLHWVRANRLTRAQRLAVWLGICRLRGSKTVVLIDPFVGVAGGCVGSLARLIREMATPGRTVLLVSDDPTVGELCSASPVRELKSTPW